MRTKWLLRLRPILRLREGINLGKSWPFLLSLAVTLLGGYISLVVFGMMASASLASVKPPKKDTVIIQMVGGLPQGGAIMSKDSASDAKPNTSAQKRNPSIGFQAGPLITNYRPIPAPRPINATEQRSALEAASLEYHRFPRWILGFAFIATVLGAFYIAYFNLPFLSREFRRDIDPEGLTNLFRAFGAEIIDLGNPRKMKRLSNKIRFQYYYLTLKKLDDPVSLKALGIGLLALEEIDNMEKLKQNKAPQEAYRLFLKYYDLEMTPADFQRIFYALNRDAFA